MSQVEKLVAKALSTSSEEEALAALRIARKKYTGGSVPVSSPHNWEALARQYHGIAVDRDGRLKSSNDRAQYFMDEMTKAQLERAKYRTMYHDAELKRKLWKQAFFGTILLIGASGALVIANMVM